MFLLRFNVNYFFCVKMQCNKKQGEDGANSGLEGEEVNGQVGDMKYSAEYSFNFI